MEVPMGLCNDIHKINRLGSQDIDDLIESNKKLMKAVEVLNNADRSNTLAMINAYNNSFNAVTESEDLLRKLRFLKEISEHGAEPVIFDQMFVCGDCQQGVVGNPDIENDVDASLIGLIWKHEFCPKCGEKVDWRNYKKIWNGW